MSKEEAQLFILIVDDSMFMRQKIATTLAQEGTRLEEAGDGLQAVATYRNALRKGRAPDAVIMDITMPNMDGIQATSEIMNLDPNARIVIASAIGQDETIRECINLGAVDYLIKPYRFEKLKTVLETAVVSPFARRVLSEAAG